MDSGQQRGYPRQQAGPGPGYLGHPMQGWGPDAGQVRSGACRSSAFAGQCALISDVASLEFDSRTHLPVDTLVTNEVARRECG